METASILGVNFHAATLETATDAAMERLCAGKKGYIVTPNPEIVYACRDNPRLKACVNDAFLVLPDGIGIIYAAKILGETLCGKVAGIEFAQALMERMAQEGRSLFLLGAKPAQDGQPSVAEQAAKALQKQHPGLVVKGTHDGYFKTDREAVDAINDVGGADVVLVCLGAPKQEYFMDEHLQEINATLLCGLGGSLDVFAGTAKRAPRIFIRLGLEWFYRLLKEPWRLGRMMKLPLFLLIVIKVRLFGQKKK